MSKGEEKVKEVLDKLGIAYEREKRVGNTMQRFDFYLTDLNISIEYQGRQHFEPVEFFGGYEGLIKTQERDARKRIYCRNNGVGIIEVGYYIPDIEDFIKRRLELIRVWRENPS